MPVPSSRSKLLPARGNVADLQANVSALLEGEICYAVDENAYYQKLNGSLVKVAADSGGGGGSYDDTALSARVTTAEGEIDALESTVGGLSNYDDSAIDGRVTQLESDVSGLSSYDDTALAARVTLAEGDIDALETSVAGLSAYDDTALAARVTTAEGDIDALEAAQISSIDDLSDVKVTGAGHVPADGDHLVWHQTMGHWMPGTPAAGGGLSIGEGGSSQYDNFLFQNDTDVSSGGLIWDALNDPGNDSGNLDGYDTVAEYLDSEFFDASSNYSNVLFINGPDGNYILIPSAVDPFADPYERGFVDLSGIVSDQGTFTKNVETGVDGYDSELGEFAYVANPNEIHMEVFLNDRDVSPSAWQVVYTQRGELIEGRYSNGVLDYLLIPVNEGMVVNGTATGGQGDLSNVNIWTGNPYTQGSGYRVRITASPDQGNFSVIPSRGRTEVFGYVAKDGSTGRGAGNLVPGAIDLKMSSLNDVFTDRGWKSGDTLRFGDTSFSSAYLPEFDGSADWSSSGVNDGDALVYDAGSQKWKPGAGGGTSIASGSFSIDTGVAETPPSDGDALVFDQGSNTFIPQALGSGSQITGSLTIETGESETPPDDGMVLAWNDSAQRYEPSTPSGGPVSGQNPIDTGDFETPPDDGDVLAWDDFEGKFLATTPSGGGGGGGLVSGAHTIDTGVGETPPSTNEVLMFEENVPSSPNFDPAAGAGFFLPALSFRITGIDMDGSGTNPGLEDDGNLGDVYIDAFNWVLYICTGPYDGNEDAGGWMSLNMDQAGFGGGGAPA